MYHKTCTCKFFNDRAICLHLIRVCLFENLILPGMQIHDKFSIRFRRKLVKNNTPFDEDFSEEEEEEKTDNDNDDIQQVEMPVLSSVNIEPLKRTRGRPPKTSSALIDDTPIIPIVKTIVKTIKKS